MLPRSAGNNQLTERAYHKLQSYYQQFCGGSNRNYYGLGHMVYACHAAFPLLLSPHLANMIWLNFKNYSSNNLTRTIAPEAVSDFLLSNVCRQVAHQQYEVDPEIRGYLLYHLKNSSWFELYGIQGFGEERLNSVAECVYRYFNEPLLQQFTAQKGFREVNEWAVLAYKNPQLLAYKVAQSLKDQINNVNSPGQLRINMLMEKLNYQYDLDVHSGENNTGSFINLYRYSKARKAVLFNEEADMVFQMIDEIDSGLTDSSILNAIELPVEKNIQDRVKRKSQDIQQVHALFVGIDEYIDKSNPLHGCVQSANSFNHLLNEIATEARLSVESIVLENSNATRENILSQIKGLYENASPQDIILFYFAGHASNSDLNENLLITHDSSFQEGNLNKVSQEKTLRTIPISNHFFKAELKKWQAIKNCQMLMILDTHAGNYDWVNEDDIFIGATTHSHQIEFFRESVSTSAFFHAMKIILSNTRGKITYEDLLSWTNYKMKNEYPEIKEQEIPILLCSKQNLTKYFLRKNDANSIFYYQSFFNQEQSLWEIIPKDFVPLKQGDPVDFMIEVDSNAIQFHRGEIIANVDHKIFYHFGKGNFPVLDSGRMFRIKPVRPPIVFELNYNSSEVTEENAEIVSELLQKIEFDEFSNWRYLQRNNKTDASRDNPNPSYIPVKINLAKKGNTIIYRIETGVVGISRFTAEITDPAKLEVFFQRLVRYEYLMHLQLPNEGVMDSIEIAVNVKWSLKTGAGRRLNNPSELSIDGRFIEVIEGEINFPPVNIEIINNESIPVFIDVYFMLSDGSITRMASLNKIIGQASERYKYEPVSININASEELVKMYTLGLTAQCKLFISRNPIHNNFSQTAIV